VGRSFTSRSTPKAALGSNLESELVDVDEFEVLVGEHPLTVNLPIMFCGKRIPHLRNCPHRLPHDE
jgi:hypothetical protein